MHHIELTADEALVLSDFLSRFQDTNRLEFAHVSEFLALNRISAVLDKALVEPFKSDYKSLVERARERVAVGCDLGSDYPGPKVDMRNLQDGWKMQLASDIKHDGMGLELLNPTAEVVAEIFRFDSTKTVVVTTFDNEIPLAIFDRYYSHAWKRLDPFEDGSTFISAGISRR